MKKNYEIKSLNSEEINQLTEVMERYGLQVVLNPYIIINLGYQFLTDSAKLTYLYMKTIADHNFFSYKKPTCNIKIEYLAIIYNTTIATQKNNINSLIKYELIKETPEGYIVYNPIIESTLEETILKLVYRKDILSTVSYLTSCHSPKERLHHLGRLEYLNTVQKEHPFLKGVYDLFKNKFKIFT